MSAFTFSQVMPHMCLGSSPFSFCFSWLPRFLPRPLASAGTSTTSAGHKLWLSTRTGVEYCIWFWAWQVLLLGPHHAHQVPLWQLWIIDISWLSETCPPITLGFTSAHLSWLHVCLGRILFKETPQNILQKVSCWFPLTRLAGIPA